MNNKAHILFISSWWPTIHTSEGTFVELHLLALQSRGCKCALLLSGEITLGNFIASGFRSRTFNRFRRNRAIHFIDNLTVHKRPLRWAKRPMEYRKRNILKASNLKLSAYIAGHGKPDFIFHHGVFDYVYLTTYLSEFFEIPVWYMEHSPNMSAEKIPCANPFDTKANLKSFAKESERRFAVTDAHVKRMTAIFGIPFEYCPNVITDDFFANPEEISRRGNVFHFANVAILDPRKNQQMLIEAFAKSFKGDQSAKLYIAGDGPLKAKLQAVVDKLGVVDQVEIIGYVDREGIKQLLDRVHCFVLSSHAETFGVVLIEAMSRGIPAISTDIDGPREIVTRKNGILCQPNDAEAMARAMLEMRANYARYDPSEIVASVASRYGPDAVTQVLFENNA